MASPNGALDESRFGGGEAGGALADQAGLNDIGR